MANLFKIVAMRQATVDLQDATTKVYPPGTRNSFGQRLGEFQMRTLRQLRRLSDNLYDIAGSAVVLATRSAVRF